MWIFPTRKPPNDPRIVKSGGSGNNGVAGVIPTEAAEGTPGPVSTVSARVNVILASLAILLVNTEVSFTLAMWSLSTAFSGNPGVFGVSGERKKLVPKDLRVFATPS